MKLARTWVAIPDGEPPTEFRIFFAGLNDSTKGSVLFDDQSAKSVMAAFEKHDVDLMIDLEHLSLEYGKPGHDPDARGWARLEMRDGELWAVNVKWTPDGERRIRERRQRYVSPAFDTDKSGRVTEVVNVAITAMPATHRAQPLIAATRFNNMDAETIKKAIEALKKEDAKAALGILEGMVTEAATGEPATGETEALAEGEGEDSPADEEMATRSDGDEPQEETATRSAAKPSTSTVDVRLAADVQKLSADVAQLKKQNEDLERSKLLDGRPDLAAELRKTLSTEPVAVVKKILSAIPKPKTPPPAAASQVKGTRGETQGTGRVARLSADEKAAMDLRMGVVETKKATVHEPGVVRFGVTVPKGGN